MYDSVLDVAVLAIAPAVLEDMALERLEETDPSYFHLSHLNSSLIHPSARPFSSIYVLLDPSLISALPLPLSLTSALSNAATSRSNLSRLSISLFDSFRAVSISSCNWPSASANNLSNVRCAVTSSLLTASSLSRRDSMSIVRFGSALAYSALLLCESDILMCDSRAWFCFESTRLRHTRCGCCGKMFLCTVSAGHGRVWLVEGVCLLVGRSWVVLSSKLVLWS